MANNDATYNGFEVELLSTPMEGLDIMTGISYTNAEVKNVIVAPNVARDVVPSFTPEWQASALARYSWPAMSGRMSAQFSANYQSSFFYNLRNFDAHRLDSYFMSNARIEWIDSKDRWVVSFFMNNVNDSRHTIIGFDISSFAGSSQESYAEPRTAGASVKFTF